MIRPNVGNQAQAQPLDGWAGPRGRGRADGRTRHQPTAGECAGESLGQGLMALGGAEMGSWPLGDPGGDGQGQAGQVVPSGT